MHATEDTATTTPRAGARTGPRPADGGGRPRGGLRRPQRSERPGIVWIVPALLFFGLFGLGPVLGVVYLSFTEWRGLGEPTWVGLENWAEMASDDGVTNGLKLTLVLTALCWATQTPMALLFGVWAAGPQRIRAVVSAVYFLPLLLSGAAIALLWLSLLDPNFGLAADIGPFVGVPDGNFVGDSSLALYVIVLVTLWQWLPFHMLLYQSAARQIPRSLYEASEIDGAGRLHQFLFITIPQLRHTIIASSVLMIVGAMTYFETVFLITGGGPGVSTRILPLVMYFEGFRAFDMGYASAIAVLLVVLGFSMAMVTVWLSGYSRMRSQREGAQ
ncbi:sugar ABC transporter permease [Lipingzhangella sp. LS1_29]|uniref:Sugar ABC transporter permease n=1 Tax=Lipingzhangella rawalii TaxID=2055835 RepID=A0ABU2H1I0_9ACTN|nr:sugar ABC transporter permease [Lipingzhangella rawalii]MDS1268847.1 sugar ABC transporter permease [Lipingzhangella rawalii]